AETLELTPPKSLINEKTGKLVFFNNLKAHKNKVLSVAFSANGKLLANSIAFSPDGKVLAAGSGDKTIALFPLE
ncbi:MAG: WD40 repeat domain-containing protein, partial [Dolichospermum sp.]